MTDSKPQTRPDGAAHRTRTKPSRHRAKPAQPASALARIAGNVSSTGRRAAVVVAACAVLVGAGAAGQASETAAHKASTEASTQAATTADPLTHLDFERVRVANQAVIPTGTPTAPAAEEKPAEAPAPAAAPAPAPAAAPEPAPAPAPVAIDDPAGAQAYAASQLGAHGWAPGQMQCLMTLWTKESDWETTATNPSSGAYGVVQSLPAEKMASAGADYRTNYRTQINWGLNYIKERYGSPCGALNFHYANNWY